jgi:O-antigen/teichoic acid export membrane protein
VPTIVSQHVYPRMGAARGANASADELRGMGRDQGLLAGALVLPVIVAIALFAWLVIPWLLPEYTDATVPVLVLSLGLLALSLGTGYGNYLNVAGGQWRYFSTLVLGLAISVPLMLAAGEWLGPTGVALGLALSYAIYGLALRAVARRTEPRPVPAAGPPPERLAET